MHTARQTTVYFCLSNSVHLCRLRVEIKAYNKIVKILYRIIYKDFELSLLQHNLNSPSPRPASHCHSAVRKAGSVDRKALAAEIRAKPSHQRPGLTPSSSPLRCSTFCRTPLSSYTKQKWRRRRD